MKRILPIFAAALVAIGLVSAALAGWNIKQKGSGATVWENQDGAEVPVGDAGLTMYIADVSTAGSHYVVSHKAGKITKAYSVIRAAITAADAVLKLYINGTEVTPNGTITIAESGSAAGDSDSTEPTGANTVAQGDVIQVHTDGGSTNTSAAHISIVVE